MHLHSLHEHEKEEELRQTLTVPLFLPFISFSLLEQEKMKWGVNFILIAVLFLSITEMKSDLEIVETNYLKYFAKNNV